MHQHREPLTSSSQREIASHVDQLCRLLARQEVEEASVFLQGLLKDRGAAFIIGLSYMEFVVGRAAIPFPLEEVLTETGIGAGEIADAMIALDATLDLEENAVEEFTERMINLQGADFLIVIMTMAQILATTYEFRVGPMGEPCTNPDCLLHGKGRNGTPA